MTRESIRGDLPRNQKRIVDQVPERYREKVAQIERRVDRAEMIADELPQDWFCGRSDEELVRLLDPEMRGGDWILLWEAVPRVLEWLFADVEPPKPFYDKVWPEIWKQLHDALFMLVLREHNQRRASRETAKGRAVRRYLVEQDRATLDAVISYATYHLRYHPEYPAQADAQEEIASLAQEQLTKRIAPIVDAVSPFRERMLLSLRGRLNGIPDKVRLSLKETLDGIESRRKQICLVSIAPSAQEEDHADSSIRFIATSSYDETTVLVEECIDKLQLDEKDRAIVQMLFQGHSQMEIAETLNMTQPAVSQRIAGIRQRFPA